MGNPHNLEVFWSREIKGSKHSHDGNSGHRSGDNFTLHRITNNHSECHLTFCMLLWYCQI